MSEIYSIDVWFWKSLSLEGDGKETSRNMCALYICKIPESLLHERLMWHHFSQFAKVEKVYMSERRRSCTVHFTTGDEAEYAQKHGGVLKGVQLNIFRSHSKSPESGIKPLQIGAIKCASKHTWRKADEDAAKKQEENTINRSSEENDDAPAEGRDKHWEKERRSPDSSRSRTPKKEKFDLPNEVTDELKISKGLDMMRVLKQPTGASQLPWKMHRTEITEATPPFCWLKSEVHEKSPTPLVQPNDTSNLAEIDNVLQQPAHTTEVSKTRTIFMKSKDLSSHKDNQGTCPDMWPERKRCRLDFSETRSDEPGEHIEETTEVYDDEGTEVSQVEHVLPEQTGDKEEIAESQLVTSGEVAPGNTEPNFVFSIDSLYKEEPTVHLSPDFPEESLEIEEHGQTRYPNKERMVAAAYRERRSNEEEELEDYDDNLEEKEEASLISLVAEEPVPKRSPVVHYVNPDFTARFSPLSLSEHAKRLHIPKGDYSFMEWRPRRIHSYSQKPCWPNIGSIFMENVITSELFTRLESVHNLEHEMFWKLLLSVPDPDESPRYCDELLGWIDETFVQDKTKLTDAPEQLETLRLAQEKIENKVMNSSVQRLVGYLDKSEPLQGINGVLVFVTKDSENVAHRFLRLLRILEVRQPLPLLPVALVTDSQRLLAEDEIWLQQLVDVDCISQFKIFWRSDVSKEKTTFVIESALKWLACNTPSSPDIEVMPLKLLWEKCIVDDIWKKISYLASKGIDKVDQNLNELINIHNSALEDISQLCLKNEIFQYSTGAREFLPFIKMSYYPPKVFINRIMPEYWRTDSYKTTVQEACASAMLMQKMDLPSSCDVPPSTLIEICMAAYPELVTDFKHAIMVLCQNEVFGDNIQRAHVIEALAEIQLARAVKQLDDEELIVAVKKVDLSAMRKQYSSKISLPAADVIDISRTANEWSKELLEPPS